MILILSILAEIVLICGVAYYYNEESFPETNQPPLIQFIRFGLVFGLFVVSLFTIFELYLFLFVR